jgi:hypothetical protein
MRQEKIIDSNNRHHFMFMDTADILPLFEKHSHQMRMQSREHGLSISDFEKKALGGDENYVAESDKFLTLIEDQVPMSRGWRNVDDVVGAVPNVPAFLAGHPQHMRRRERVSRDNTPLTIFMDLTSSMVIHKSHVLKRGTVLLALARMLVEHRPVELWAGSVLLDTNSTTVAWRIDTTPMDLARAAFHISDPLMSRVFGYGVARSLGNEQYMGTLSQNVEKENRLRMISGWGETLYIPGIHRDDPMTTDPISWIRRIMKRYVGESE